MSEPTTGKTLFPNQQEPLDGVAEVSQDPRYDTDGEVEF